MEGVGEAGEEVECDQIGDDEGEENWKNGELPERESLRGGFGGAKAEEFEVLARDESEGERQKNKSDAEETELEEEADSLVLDDGVGDGIFVSGESFGHGDTGATEADAEENVI